MYYKFMRIWTRKYSKYYRGYKAFTWLKKKLLSMLASITVCTPSYLSSFTGMWAYRQNVLTRAFSYRACSSIAINILLSINTLCYLLIMSSHTAGQQHLSDLCTEHRSVWVIMQTACFNNTWTNHTRSHFKPISLTGRPTITQTRKIEPYVTPHTCLIYLYAENCMSRTRTRISARFPVKRHHKTPCYSFCARE